MSFSTTNKMQSITTTCLRAVLACGLIIGLSGCDYVTSFISPASQEEQRDEGMALGAGCRQAGQTLEDCYVRNPKSMKAGIYAGWKEMHEYMAAMNIETAKSPTDQKAVEALDPVKAILDPKSEPATKAKSSDARAVRETRATREAKAPREPKAERETNTTLTRERANRAIERERERRERRQSREAAAMTAKEG